MKWVPADGTAGCRVCPACGRPGRVLETRKAPGGVTRRRYGCGLCGSRWKTREEVVGVDRTDANRRGRRYYEHLGDELTAGVWA